MKSCCNSFLFVYLPAIIIIYQVTSSTAGCIRPEIIDTDIELIDDLPIYDDGTVVILFCDTSQNYVGYGPVAIYCSTDTWVPDPSPRECKAPCNAPVVTAGVSHYDADSGKTGDVYLDNTAIQFACEDTERTTLYHEQGLEKSICTDGSWDSQEAPICAESCTAPPNALPSGLFRHMVEVTFACEPGFQPIGQTEFICLDGQWNGEFSCEAIPSDEPTERTMTEKPQPEQTTKQPATTDPPIVCDFPDIALLDPDAIVSPMQDGYTLFSLIELSCGGTELTTSDGPSRFACYNRGMWLPSIEDFKCYLPCNAPLASTNVYYITLEGQNVDELYSHNAVIDFICKSDKQLLYGPSLVSCYDGEWNPQQVPTCEDVNPFELKFQITHIDGSPATYKTDYADEESQTFIEMETELVNAIETIYTMLDGYLLSKIVSFSDPGTSGLEVYAVVFIDKSSVSGTLEEVSAETDRILGQSASIDGLSSSFTLDYASVLVSEPCEVPDLQEGIVFESSNEPLENVWYPDSTTFSLSCGEEDYIIDGPTQLICENGAWMPEGEAICIELQTTSTADVTETLRQTTPIAETTSTTQQTQSTDVQSETPLISAMSTSAFTTSTYTLEPHDTTTPLQTISEISVSDMTTHISASQATTTLTVETTDVLTMPEGEITVTEDSELTDSLSTYGNDFTTSGSLGYTASTVTLNSVDDVTTYETVRTDTSVRTDHTTRATNRGISDMHTSVIPTTGDQTSFPTTRISFSPTDRTTATNPISTTDLQPTKEVSTLISSVSPTPLHTDVTFTSSDASEPTRVMTNTPTPFQTTYEEQSATARTGKSTHALTTSDEVYTGTFSSSTSGPSLGTERLYTITKVTVANTEEDGTTDKIKPTIETSTPLTSFTQTPSQTNIVTIGTPKATDSISPTTLTLMTGPSESSDVTTSNAPTESDATILTTEFLATSLSDTKALSTTLVSISNFETSQTTQGSTKDSISAKTVQTTTYQEKTSLSTDGPTDGIPTDLMTTSSDEQFTENALTSRITATESTTDVTNVALTTAGEKTVKTTDMFSSTITEVTMTNTEEEVTTHNIEPTIENLTPLTSFPQTPRRTNTVGIGTPEATDSISPTTLGSVTGPSESSDITTSNARTESVTDILTTEFLATSLSDTEASSTTLNPISNLETSQTTQGSTMDSISAKTVQTTTYQEKTSLPTDGPTDGIPTDLMTIYSEKQLTENALTSRITATEYATVVTNVVLTTAGEQTVEPTDMFSPTIPEVTMNNTKEEVTTDKREPTIENSTPLTSFPQTPRRTNTDNIMTPKVTDYISPTTLASMTGPSESSDITTPNAPTESDTDILTTEFLATSLSDTEASSNTLNPISNLETSQTTEVSTQDIFSATSGTTHVTQFHATIEETEAIMTRTSQLGNEATSETLTEWVPLTTVYSDETTANDLLTTVRRPVTYTTEAYSTDHPTDEPFKTGSAQTMTRSDDPTTNEITETTEGVLKTSPPFTSTSRMNSHDLTTSQDTRTAEELSTSAFFHPSTVAPTEGGLFSTHETVSAVSDEVTDSDLVTFHSATTPDSFEQTTHIPEDRTAFKAVTSTEANQETSYTITDLKTGSNEGYSIATQQTEVSTDVGTMMETMNSNTPVDRLTERRTTQIKTTAWKTTENDLETEDGASSPSVITTTDERTTEDITSRTTSGLTTSGITPTADDMSSTTEKETTFERTTEDITSRITSGLTTSGITPTADDISSTTEKETTFERTAGDITSRTTSGLTTSGITPTADDMSSTTGKETTFERTTGDITSRTTSGLTTSRITPTADDMSSTTEDITSRTTSGLTTSGITPTADDMLSTTEDITSRTTSGLTTSGITPTADDMSSTTEDFTSRTKNGLTTSGITPTADDMSSTTENISSRTTSGLTTSGITPTADDMSSTTEDITSRTTSDLTTSGITPTTDDMSSTTEDITSRTTSDLTTSEITPTADNMLSMTEDISSRTTSDLTTSGITPTATAGSIATASPALPNTAMTIDYASTMNATNGDVTSTLHHLTSTKDMPSSSMLTYADTSNPTPKNTVQTTTYQEKSSLSTYGPSSTLTDVIMTSAENALTSRITVTESTTDVTNVVSTTAGERIVETTDIFSSTFKESTPEITDSLSSSQETVATKTDTHTVTPATTEATEGVSTTQIHTQEPCNSCNPKTETCLDGRCECRPSKYRVFSSEECLETNSFTLTFRILLIENSQAIFSKDLLEKQSSAYQILQGDLVKSINSIFDDLSSFLGSEIFSFQSGSIITTSLVYFESNSLVTNASLTNHIDDVLTTGEYIISSNSSYTLDASNIVIQATDECSLGIDDCSPFATCSDIDKEGFNCTCIEGYTSISNPSGLHCETVTTTYTTENVITSTVTANGNSPSIATLILIAVSVVGGAIIICLLVSLICVIRKSSKRKITHPEESLVVPKAKKDNKLEPYRGYYTSFNESIAESTDSVEDTAL